MIDSRDLSFEILRRVDQVCEGFEHALSIGEQPSIESIVGEEDDATVREYLLKQLVAAEIDHQGSGFNHATCSRYQERFTGYETVIEAIFRQREMTMLVEDSQKTIVSGQAQDESLRLIKGAKFGKYEIVDFIGEGSFGVVYSARDTDLERDVALKLSRFKLSESSEVQNRFVDEAKSAAKIKGDGVATIFDLFTEDDRICIVQEFIDGSSLSRLLQRQPLSVEHSILIAMDVAGSIALAHDQGIYHRDLKPGNIIINRSGNPILVDFGLAVNAHNLENRIGLCGTPNYMSPEQVRGESNRTNNTTDIWALGVVLYEMLTGVRPFGGSDNDQLFESIQSENPVSIYDVKPDLTKELNRIVFKCIAKRQRDRYSSADLLVKDLKRYLRAGVSEVEPSSSLIVPKGLRSFSEADQGFYLSLLPGPLDHRGVPESIAFWASQINEQEDSFPVGLIYGTSGCGKSSFVKAGLLPQLSENIRTLYIEANQFDTELRVFSKLRAMFSGVSENMSLPDTLATIRDGGQLRDGEKVLIVIDQFEQWLSANGSYQESQLGYALRHCDGKSVQALLLIREDYWPTASRFMEHIEVPVVQDRNCRSVELFDRSHARNLLFQIGRAHQRFQTTEPDEKQLEFLNRVVNDISENDRVVGIRLAMFSEAFKDKDWTIEGLSEFGGADGTGVAFLNETFVLPGAPPAYKSHYRAAQNCLQVLLPVQGSNLKGHMKPRSELLEVSGYAHEPERFNELLDILEKQLKLITSKEPLEKPDQSDPRPVEPFFQLSHDYLVPVTRRWIDIEDRRHLQGRTEAKMNEVSEIWGAAKHRRYLPTWWETISILLFSRWKQWTDLQRQMMAASIRKHSIMAVFGMLIFSFVVFSGYQFLQRQRINESIQVLKTTLLTGIKEQVDSFRPLKNGLIPGIQQEIGRLKSVKPLSEEHQQLLAGENLKLAIGLAILNDSNWNDVAKGFDFVPTDQVDWLAGFLEEKKERFIAEFVRSLDADLDYNDENQFRKAIALAQWGRPKHLTAYLTHRQPNVAKSMLPLLKISPEATVAALQEIVAKLKTSVFLKPSAQLIEMVEEFDGGINDASGVMLSVPFGNVDNTLKRLFAENYAPTSVRPYYLDDEKLVAMAFRRGHSFKSARIEECVLFQHAKSASELVAKAEELEQNGWAVADISHISDPTGAKDVSHSAIWLRDSELTTKLKMDVSYEDFQASIEEHSKEGFQIKRMFSHASESGAPVYSLIWSKPRQGAIESVPFLAYPEVKYSNKSTNNVQGASLADSQLIAIDLSERDRFQLHFSKRKFDEVASRFLEGGALIPNTSAKSVHSLGFYHGRLGQMEDARKCFQRVVEDNPGWVDTDLEYIKFLSRVPDAVAYEEEFERLEDLKLNAGQEKVRLPMSKLRLAVFLGNVEEAAALYQELVESFDVLEVEYRKKTESLEYIKTSRIRAAVLYALALDDSNQEVQDLLDWSVEKLKEVKQIRYEYVLCDPDFDVLRDHPGFQELLCSKGFGFRRVNSWRFDPGRSTHLDYAESMSSLVGAFKLSLASGYIPKTASCLQLVSKQRKVVGQVVSEKRLLDEVGDRKKKSRMARSAIMLDALGQPELIQEIEKGNFGEELKYILRAFIDEN